jgi:hypothetical protein
MMAPLAPAAGVRLYYLDDAGVLFSPATQELHLLNPTAAVIWSLLEEGHGESGLTAALCESHGLAVERGAQFVAAALAEWREKGFLAGSERVAPFETAPKAVATPASPSAWRAFSEHELRRYRLLSSRFAVRVSSAAQSLVVRSILSHLETHDPPPADETRLDVVEGADGIVVYRDRELYARCDDIGQLAPIVKSAVWVTALRDQRYFLNIHAGVVSDGKRCVLLPAAPGSGKSTLTAALIHAGYEFFSDEVALLEDRTLHVRPVPLAICVKDSGIDALADRFPVLRDIAIHARGDGKRVAYMPPPAKSLPARDEARPVAALIFPRYTSGAEASLVPLRRGDALHRLMGECLTVAEPLDSHRVETIVRWIARIPCHALRYGSTDAALASIASVFPLPPVQRRER